LLESDLPSPISRHVLTATDSDDTAFLATSDLRRESTDMVQDMLNEFEAWALRWNIFVNPERSLHAIFSLIRLNTYPFTLDGIPIKHSVGLFGSTTL